MENGLVIQSGIYKGRKIPFPDSIKGHSNFTPALFKKSIFAIIETEVLNGKFQKDNAFFIDLFAGSGQMGIEAVSRGFEKSVFFEMDRLRFRALLHLVHEWKIPAELHHKDGFRAGAKWENDSERALVVYMDPPYTFWETAPEKLHKVYIDWKNRGSYVFIQAPQALPWEGVETRTLGNHTLLVSFPL
jgi:16S rRNA (guanine966-N2)-methyltransferase